MNVRDEGKIKTAIKHANKEARPTPKQERVKERFYRRLREQHHIIDKETAFSSPQWLEQLAGTVRIHEWMQSPQFAQWMMDEHVVADELMALRHRAVGRIQKILENADSADADALKAARLIFEVTDQFPSKKQEVKFLDQELERMPDPQVELEIRKLQAKLLGDDNEN